MDIGATVSEVRKEYKDYLREKHPEWAENTVKTHVSDAFYIWNNTLLPSFWKTLIDDDSMEIGRQAIYAYLKNDLLSDTAEVRAKAYFADLTMLKEFLDTVHGGVIKRVGYEIDCEKTVYKYAKMVYDGQITADQAVEAMVNEVPCFNNTSHKMTVMLFASMMNGEKYTRRANTETTLYFINQMGADYGKEHMVNALKATQENVKYYYEQSGNKSNSICRGCKKIAMENGIDIPFDDSIFEGIIPKKNTTDDVLTDQSGVRYWIYSPYDAWDEFCNTGIMTIGRDYLGDPMLYESKSQMQSAMQDCGTERDTTTYKNAVLEVWQFIHEIKPGDIIIAKKGTKTVLGRGVVTSEFIYDEKKPTDFKYYRQVNWTHKGEWEHPGKAVTKTLTDITRYTDYVAKLEDLFVDEDSEQNVVPVEEPEVIYDSYTADNFLQDVYMSEERYNTLANLLMTKKNIILQGAPGVGKTYAAKRLAYSIMGEKDTSRVKMVQFHQSYSYEDFIMGFRPTQTGFELHEGVFYKFCRKAADDDRPYFFIIDEINRGNLSKIFGELFMLIESDKRGVELQLLYKDEQFSIPSNVHIIGMMNTADRSLAMLDYALRRRFAFFDILPAFDSTGFRAYRKNVNNPKFDKLISAVQQLNEAITNDESLGEGFCVGHSYFCTNVTINDEWLKSVVEYELIPLLKEYWFDEPTKVRTWTNTLREVIK